MKKIDGYPHNGYLTDINTGTGRIFIQRVRYGRATTRTLPVPLTSLVTFLTLKFERSEPEIFRRCTQELESIEPEVRTLYVLHIGENET